MTAIKVIVNPLAGRGYAGKVSPLIERHFDKLGADFDLVHTSAAGDAIHLAREAMDQGFDTIVAVGGDGTSHEVVNGMMLGARDGIAGNLGCIPTGSGNDFAVTKGAPIDLEAACRLIVAGNTRLIDVGQVIIDGRTKRYFGNAVGIGFTGLVVKETMKYGFLRGMALYLPVVLKTVFLTLRAPQAEITLDGDTIRQKILLTEICNGPREGGCFFIAPQARPDDGLLDVLIGDDMPRLQILGMIPRIMKGTHVGDRRVKMRRARHIVVSSPDPLHLHVDGEILCDEAHHVEAEVIPGRLRIIAPERNALC